MKLKRKNLKRKLDLDANSSILYTDKFGNVLLLFLPNVSSKEDNVFFIFPSFW